MRKSTAQAALVAPSGGVSDAAAQLRGIALVVVIALEAATPAIQARLMAIYGGAPRC